MVCTRPAGSDSRLLELSQLRPTAMLYRNLASMDVEESIRACPWTASCC